MTPHERLQKLRAEGDLHAARRLGEEILSAGEDTPQILAALTDVYLDIEADCLRAGVTSYINEIDRRVDELLKMSDDSERRAARHRALKLTTLNGYAELHAFEELSHHDGHEAEAYTSARDFLTKNAVDPRLHETVALILYRYLRADYTRLGSREARRLLADYVALAVPKPSRTHSLMLRMAVRVARRYDDFNFARFFMIWDPRMLRPEDIDPRGSDGRPLPSLAMAAIARIVDSPYAGELPDLLQLIPASPDMRLSILRDAFYSLVSSAINKGDDDTAAELLRLYSLHATLHTASERHSAMLALGLKVFRDSRASSFPEYFVAWDPYFMRKADFLPSTNSRGEQIPPLASRAMSRCFSVIRNDIPRHSYLLPQVIRAFDTIADIMPGRPDELLERRRAMLLAWNDCEDTAIDRFCAMATRPGHHSARFYLDFAEILPSQQLKKGIIALGIIRCSSVSEDADTSSLRLSLAQQLHFDGLDDRAALELKLYSDEIASIAAEPSARYGAIAATIDTNAIMPPSNDLLYHTLAAEALDFIYRRIPSREMSVIEADGDTLLLSDGTSQPLGVDTHTWPVASRLALGANVSVKLDTAGSIVAIKPVDNEPYAALPLYYGIVTAVDPPQVHCAGKTDTISVRTSEELHEGDTVSMRVYRDREGHRVGIRLKQLPIASARRHFEHLAVAVYELRPDGSALYSVGPESAPGEIPAALSAGLQVGEPVEIYFYRTKDGERHVISRSEAIRPESCKALKTVSGPLSIAPDGTGSVRDIHIPASLLADNGISDNTYIKATAVYLPRRGSSTPIWQGVTVDIYR